MKAAREARQASIASSATPTRPPSSISSEARRAAFNRDEIDKVVADLLRGDPSSSSGGGKNANSVLGSSVGSETNVGETEGERATALPNEESQSKDISSPPAPTALLSESSVSQALPLLSLPEDRQEVPLGVPERPVPKVTYDKSIQTSDDLVEHLALAHGENQYVGPGAREGHTSINGTSGGVGRENAVELRNRIIKELELEKQHLDTEIAEETRKAELLAESERARGLPAPILSSVLANPSFLDFLNQSEKIVERALSDSYDYLRDYSVAALDEEGIGSARGGGQQVRLIGSWYEERWARGRSVTGVDWSPKYPELFVASYSKNPMAANEPDGVACIWNLHLLERPEYVFHAQSDILSVSFSPFHPNLVIGGTYAGQICLWDTRSRHSNPVLKTPLSASGHTHPIYSLNMIGTQNAHNLISASTDGTVCAWTLDMLARPQESLGLLNSAHNKTEEVGITSLGFPEGETSTFLIGTEEGNVYSANRYDRAGAKAGLIQNRIYKGHSGPVTGLDFHPASGSVDLGDLFLTSGVDWTVKLWKAGDLTGNSANTGPERNKTSVAHQSSTGISSLSRSQASSAVIQPLLSFEGGDDHVYDVKWHPKHPAVFATVDGAGKFDLWNVNVDTEISIVSTLVGNGRGLNKVAWDRNEGRRAVVGSSDGKAYVYEISQELITPKERAWEMMRKTCNNAAAAQAAAASSSAEDNLGR